MLDVPTLVTRMSWVPITGRPTRWIRAQLILVLVCLWAVPISPASFGISPMGGGGGGRKYEVVLTKAAVDYLNPAYLGPGAFMRITRKSRSSTPALNAFFPMLQDLNDINATYVGLQKLDNKWKESIVRINWDFCESLSAKYHLHRVMLDRTNFPSACPIPKGNYTINDFKFDHPNLPTVSVPGGKDWRLRGSWGAGLAGDPTITTFWFEFKIDRSKQALHP